MKFTITNLGPIKNASLSTGLLTIVCGKNNTGKSYLLYSFYGILDFINEFGEYPVTAQLVNCLIKEGVVKIPVTPELDAINNLTQSACMEFKRFLPLIFAAPPNRFKSVSLDLTIEKDDLKKPSIIKMFYRFGTSFTLDIVKDKTDEFITVTLVFEDRTKITDENTRSIIKSKLGSALRKIYLSSITDNITFASTERTGTLLFNDELSPSRGHDISGIIESEKNIEETVTKITSLIYPLPIAHNINFIKRMGSMSKTTSPLVKKYPFLLKAFNEISGGSYTVNQKGVFFTPGVTNTKVSLSMDEASSSVRSLGMISFWLEHMAKSQSTLLIDEPEMNLHPHSQRLLARFVSMLVNCGVKVFITTHSDYFVKEINTLVMLHSRKRKEFVKAIMATNDITTKMLLPAEEVKVYIAESTPYGKTTAEGKRPIKTVVKESVVDPLYGAPISSFDSTIDDMNRLQNAVIFHD